MNTTLKPLSNFQIQKAENLLENNLHKPLTIVPDPFKKYESFGQHNNEMLKKFLNKFNFNYHIVFYPMEVYVKFECIYYDIFVIY